MYNVISASTPRSGPGPWLSNTYITLPAAGGLKLVAFGMAPGDTVKVKAVQLGLEGTPTHESHGCFTTCPGKLKVLNSVDYALCGIVLTLTSAANVVYLKGVGQYALEFNGPSFVAGTVVVTGEEMPGSDISDLMMKCPCPCPAPVVIPVETDCTLGAKITTAGAVNLGRVVSKTAAGCLQEGPLTIPAGFAANDCTGAAIPTAGAQIPLCGQLPAVAAGTNITSVVPTTVGAGATAHTLWTVNAPNPPTGFTANDCSGAPIPGSGASIPLCTQLPTVLAGTNITSVTQGVTGAGPTLHPTWTVNAPSFCSQFGALTVGAYACTDTVLVRHADGSCERVPLPSYTMATACGLSGTGAAADPLRVTVALPALYTGRGFAGTLANDSGLWCAPDGSLRTLPEHYHVMANDLQCYNPSLFGPFTNRQVVVTSALVTLTNPSQHRSMTVYDNVRVGDWVRNKGPNRHWNLLAEVSVNGGPFTDAGYTGSGGFLPTQVFSERLGNMVTLLRGTNIAPAGTRTLQVRVVIEVDAGSVTDANDFLSTGCLDVIMTGQTL